jgi:hypothetical protein
MAGLVVCMELRELLKVLARWAAKHARRIFSSGNSNPKRTRRYMQTASEFKIGSLTRCKSAFILHVK